MACEKCWGQDFPGCENCTPKASPTEHDLNKYTAILKFESGYKVYLVSGTRQFCVTPFEYETIEEAEWMRQQLVKVLSNIIEKEKNTNGK